MSRIGVASAITTLATLAAVTVTTGAHAEGLAKQSGRRVVVLSPHPDDVSARIRRELQGVALDARVITFAGECEAGQIVGEEATADAASVVCLDANGIGVWIPENGQFFQREQIAWARSEPSTTDQGIVQATEAVRARLAQMPAVDDAAKKSADAAPQKTDTGIVVTQLAAPEKDSATAPAPTAPARKTPRFLLGAGMSWLTSVGYNPTWGVGLDAEVGVSRHASLVVNAVLPVSSAQFSGPGGVASAQTTEIGIGTSVPFATPDSMFIPRLGGGWGLVWMHTKPVSVTENPSAASFAASQSTTPTTREEDLVSPMLYGNASLSMRVYGPVRLVADAAVAMTAARFYVRSNDVDSGSFGWPLLVTQLRTEVLLP